MLLYFLAVGQPWGVQKFIIGGKKYENDGDAWKWVNKECYENGVGCPKLEYDFWTFGDQYKKPSYRYISMNGTNFMSVPEVSPIDSYFLSSLKT